MRKALARSRRPTGSGARCRPPPSPPRRSPWRRRAGGPARSLRPGDAPGTLLLRDNEGRLHRVDLEHGGADSTLALDFEVIKDFDYNPRQGFLIASYAPNALDNVCLWHLPREGGSRRLLIADPYLNELPRWLPSGDRFLFAKSHGGKSRLCLMTANFLSRSTGTRNSSGWNPW